MPTPVALLKSLGVAALGAVDVGPLGNLVVVGDTDLARTVWGLWARGNDEPQRLAEIQALARATAEEGRRAVAAVVEALAAGQPEPNRQALRAYLVHLPAAIRQALRRPADPSGLTLPPWLTLREAADLLPLLPAHTPWFAPGNRIDGWELDELLAADSLTETWKARNAESPAASPTAIEFCLDASLREVLRGDRAAWLERATAQPEHPGLLKLRRAALSAEPPYLQYDYFEAGNLAALVREGHAEPNGPAPIAVACLVRQLAEALAPLHQLDPPLVHRGLRPRCILVRSSDNAKFTCKIADLGVADLLPAQAGRDGSSELYLAPEQARGVPPHPRDDVFALGVLWYQLLSGNLAAGRPGGSTWRRKLADRGMAAGLIDLLEACFEDDPEYRPANAADLAKQLAELLAPPAATAGSRRPAGLAQLSGLTTAQQAPSTPSTTEGPSRLRQRRSDVWQVFDALEKPEQELVKLLTNSLGVKLVLLQPGSFLMGSPPTEKGRCAKEGPQHEVQLTNPFYLAVYPVTQDQFQRVMGKNPSRFQAPAGGGPEHPVESVTWDEAVEFCRRLSALPPELEACRTYRLPTEAEWEYACRAGMTTAFAYGDTLSSTQANFDGAFPFGEAARGPAAQKTTRVGSYPPNHFGLCDMHGNVWEWCADWHDSDWYRRSPRRNPTGPPAGQFRVLRGGCWRSHAATCRSAYRNGLQPQGRDRYTGFRVVMEIQKAEGERRNREER